LKSSSFHIDGNVEICELDQRQGNRRRQDVKPDPQRHQRRAETGQSGDETTGKRASKQDRVGGCI
jgi:hypothetical protein